MAIGQYEIGVTRACEREVTCEIGATFGKGVTYRMGVTYGMRVTWRRIIGWWYCHKPKQRAKRAKSTKPTCNQINDQPLANARVGGKFNVSTSVRRLPIHLP
jgi:hypothetical protein